MNHQKKLMRMKLLLFIALILLCCYHTSAQQVNWGEVEAAISKKTNLADLTNRLELIKKDAVKNNDAPVITRCYYHQMQIADLKSEDTTYFYNSHFIDSILSEKETALLTQSILLILKAKRIAGFRHRFFYKTNKNLFLIPDNTTDYRKLNTGELDSLVQLYLEQAKQISLLLKKENAENLLWLSTDPLLFLFKPDYTDIIFAEQLHYTDAANSSYYGTNNDWLLLKPDEFINHRDIPQGINKQLNPVYKLYQYWAHYHEEEPGIFYFIESLARKYFYNKRNTATDSINTKFYETYLKQLSNSPYTEVKAHGIYQLCLYWHNLGKQYNNSFDVYDYGYRGQALANFDSTYRYYFIQTLDLFEKNSNLLDSFFYLKKNLLVMKQEIQSKKINIQNKDVYSTGEPVTYHLSFKNVHTLHIKIIKLNSVEFQINKRKIQTEQLINTSAFKTITLTLPDTKDYQAHASVIEMDSLPLGYYAVLYSDSTITNTNKNSSYFTFNVSNITTINNDSRVFVLDRESGLPLSYAQLLVKYKSTYNGPIKNASIKKVNREGYTIVKEEYIQDVFVMNGPDTLEVSVNEKDMNKPDAIFDKEEDELLDYYEDNMLLHLFTDRAIYRPGQTVYFKGIILIRNPTTGERVVLNNKNLKFSFLKKLFNKEVKELTKEKLEVYIVDAFGKTVDTLKLLLNEFGSFSGSYKISEKAATGDWQLDTDIIDIDNQNDGHFKVEEYKRPSFEIVIEKPTDFLQLGDSFLVKIKVKSFAGAQLNNVMVNYDVEADFYSQKKDSITGTESEIWAKEEIADTTGYTDNNGELLIKIPAGFLKQYEFSKKQFREIKYTINAEAVDATGESHEEALDIRLTNRPVKIDFAVANMYERNEMGLVSVTAKNEFSGAVTKLVEASIYKVDKKSIAKDDEWAATDYLLKEENWNYKIQTKKDANELAEKPLLIYQKTLTSNTDKLALPKELLESGDYKLVITCKENGNIVGEKSRVFSVFDRDKGSFPGMASNFHHLPINSAAKGEKIKWYFGSSDSTIYSIYHAQYFANTSKGIKVKYIYDVKPESKGIKEWNFIIPEDAIDEIYITHLYVLNKKLYKQKTTLYVTKTAAQEPEIIIEQYRKKLTPGSKETFVVTIKTRNENIAAELMTTMYDASLDKIEKHIWTSSNEHIRYYLNESWQDDINGIRFNSLFNKNIVEDTLKVMGENTNPLWWLNPLDYAYDGFIKNMNDGNPGASSALQGRVAGISITGNNALSEVVVVGYGSVKRDLTGSIATIRVRGLTSFGSNNAPLIIVDGVVYTGELNKINLELITDGIILNGIDATAIYGSKAANGVILISTKGPLQLPKPEEPIIKVRRNFSETAFFFPQVHADAEGFYNINFTIPESVTEWNWKMLAHSKDAKFMYAQRSIVTQLPLMVQPNMPRFLYQGDVISLQTRISNLDTVNISGTSKCMIEDAVTGENITSVMMASPNQNFSIDKKSNKSIAYQLTVPGNLLHPLKIKVSAQAGSFSDGEEYTIPILSKKILVSQNVPFVISNSTDTAIATPAVAADAVPYGIGMYISAKPQAAMVNALPYLAFYPYGCAEQTFNKMLAHAVAIKIIQTDTAAQQTIKQLQAEPEENNMAALPEELSEQTMPWLQLNHSTKIHQQQLLKIFDTLQSKVMLEKYINDLSLLQNDDGGISWFKAGKSSSYISYYLLGGFGKLKNDSISFLLNQTTKSKFNKMLPALVSFCDQAFISKEKDGYQNIFYLLSRSYWLNEYPLPANTLVTADSVLSEAWEKMNSYNLGKQAYVINTSMLYKGKENMYFKKAVKQLESIRQLAIDDNINGIRWKDISNADDFESNNEETITQLAAAFETTGTSKNVVEGIMKWLLKSKEQHNWSTTKATALVVGLLYKHQSTATGIPMELSARPRDSMLSVTDNLLKGQLFGFGQQEQFPAFINVKKNNTITASGGFNYYYFTATPPLNENYSGVKISKQFFRLNSGKWEIMDEKTILKIADKIKTIISITTPKQLKYVFIDDKRSAAAEPADATSGYEYGKDFSYYKSVRDAGYQFFTEQIPSGISTIAYETVIAKEGVFNNGPVSLQCMYQPQVRAYGAGVILQVK